MNDAIKKRTCIVFVFNGFADWEPALAIAGLQQFTDVEVKTFSVTGKEVRSMGNMLVLPDFSLDQISTFDYDMLLLPGGNAWDEGKNLEILPVVERYIEQNILLAAICGATSFLGQHSYLDDRPHTSNHLEFYLKKMAPSYRGENHYRMEPCVTDKNLITASGTATVPFAEAIFRKLGVFDDEHLKFWFQFFRHPQTVSQ